MLRSICAGYGGGLPSWAECVPLLAPGRLMPNLKLPFLFAGECRAPLLLLARGRRIFLVMPSLKLPFLFAGEHLTAYLNWRRGLHIVKGLWVQEHCFEPTP